MKRFFVFVFPALATVLLLVISLFWNGSDDTQQIVQCQYVDPIVKLKQEGKIVSDKQKPNDWFYIQRAYPFEAIPPEKPRLAFEAAREMRASGERESVYWWEEIGPTNIPGRITDLAIHESDTNTIYAASAAGGVFKSTTHGQYWYPIFDEVGVQSVGAIAIHPYDPNILYVGTGEANAAADTYEGTGVYKSTDAGVSWTFAGLPNSYHIGRIVIDPFSEWIFVAVAGKHFGGTNPERGLYRSTDGGDTWERKLYVTDSTCCIDVALYSDFPNCILFAAMWEKVRYKGDRIQFGGMSSGLWRSFDCGDTWELLSGTGGFPAPAENISRIGVTVGESGVVYASIIDDDTDNLYGVYRSDNFGDSWDQLDDTDISDIFGGFGWYFGQIRVAPYDPDLVYILGVDLYASFDGGLTWFRDDSGIHVDHHAMTILQKPWPDDYFQVYDGCDGGVNYKWKHYESDWEVRTDMPNTQFYAITIDYSNPSVVFGGTQDNGTLRHLGGPSDSWEHVLGGDGFYCVVDHTDPDIVYAEYQWGYLRKSLDGGAEFTEDALGDMDYESDRHNWCTPFVMDPFDHNTLYYGSNRLWKTTNGGTNWLPISDDLSDGPYPTYPSFGTITTIAVASSAPGILYAGTDDGNVQVSTDGGGSWLLRNSGLPDRYVTRVAVDPDNEARAFVTLSGYNWSDPMPHIFESTDFGVNWTLIHGNLPDAPINDVIPNPNDLDSIWIATDYGVYVTGDHGASWGPLGEGMPIVPVHDITYSDLDGSIVAGTHGRSMYRLHLIPDNCGDVDDNGWVRWEDAEYLINYMLLDSGLPVETAVADVDRCGSVNMSDIVYLFEYWYFGGPEPCKGSVTCNLPTGSNSIEIGCPVDVPVLDVDSIAVPIYITNDTPICGVTIAFHYNSSDLEVTSVDSTGTVFPSGNMNYWWYSIHPDENTVLIGHVDFDQILPLNPQSGGLLATMYIQIPPGTSDQIVNFDSAFVAPACEFILSAKGGGTIKPAFVDCGAAEIRIGSCVDGIGEGCVYEQTTPPGTDTYVDLNAADLEFDNVTGSGSTEMTITTTGPSGSSTFEIIPVAEPLYYNISTTATYEGNVVVCIEYDDSGMSLEDEQALTMLHWDGLSWTDITISVDTDNNIVCGETSELSPFVLAISQYICGDADASGEVDIDDVVYLIAYIFSGGPEPVPYESGDVNCASGVDIDDVVWLISYIFSGGNPPCDTDGDGTLDC